jgi:CRP-like cAMP-binding protein
MAGSNDILIRKFRSHSTLAPLEIDALNELRIKTRSVRPLEDIVREGDKPYLSVVIWSGMAARYKSLAGGKRQFVSFHFPGDMPDLQSLFLDTMDHSLCALGEEAEVGTILHDDIFKLTATHTGLMKVLWRETLIDGSIFREWIANRSRNAVARMAHLFCELYFRADAVGLVTDKRCYLPLTQTHLAEALGTSLVHVNRTIRELRANGYMEFKDGWLTVSDWSGLAEIAEFDPAYLHSRERALA